MYLESLKSKLKNEDLVICDKGYLSNNKPINNRWFHTDRTPTKSNVINFKTDLLLQNNWIFADLAQFTQLKRLKVSQISFDQLRQFHLVNNLEHLEIDLLVAELNRPGKNGDLVRLPKLKKLYIGEFDKMSTRILFDTPLLEAVYFGTCGPFADQIEIEFNRN